MNSALRGTGLGDGIQFLNTPYAVIGGLVYGYVVFMILPVYALLERMDVSSRPARTSTTARCAPSSP